MHLTRRDLIRLGAGAFATAFLPSWVFADDYAVGKPYRDGWIIDKIELGTGRDGKGIGEVQWGYKPLTGMPRPVSHNPKKLSNDDYVDHSQVVTSHNWDTLQEAQHKTYADQLADDEVLVYPSYWVEGEQDHKIRGGKVLWRPNGASHPGDPIICAKQFRARVTFRKGDQRLVRTWWWGRRMARCNNDYPCVVVTDVHKHVPVTFKPKNETSQVTINAPINVDLQFFISLIVNEERQPIAPVVEQDMGYHATWQVRVDDRGSVTTTSSVGGAVYSVTQVTCGSVLIPTQGPIPCPPGSTPVAPPLSPPPGVHSGPNGLDAPPIFGGGSNLFPGSGPNNGFVGNANGGH